MRRTDTLWSICIVFSIMVVLASYLVYASLHPSLLAGPVDREIVSEIQKRCAQGHPCALRLKDVVNNFDWDTMYVFEMGASRADIESVIHVPLNHNPDLVKTLIFTNRGQLTHYEEEAEEVEKATDRDLNFNIQQSRGYKQFSKDVVFSVSIEKFDKGVAYGLTAVP